MYWNFVKRGGFSLSRVMSHKGISHETMTECNKGDGWF